MLHIVIFQAIIAPIIVESMMNMAIQSAQIRETGQVIPKRTPPNTPNIVATANIFFTLSSSCIDKYNLG